jgi:uncharacterized membrane protein YccC
MSKPVIGETMSYTIQRAIGTAVGGWLACGLLLVLPHWWQLALVMTALAATCLVLHQAIPRFQVAFQLTVITAYVGERE